MSLTDKLIKNTYFHLLSQAVNFLSPFILIPVIIGSIGAEDYGIYVLVLGFIGTFGLLDLSFSSSFVKFIAEYYNKKQNQNLIEVINTGFLFYILFSALIITAALLISDHLFGLVKIPPEKYALAKNVFYISLVIFFITNSFGIFNSFLIGIQKMYQGAVASIFVTGGYFTAVLILMIMNAGLISLMIVQLVSGVISVIITIILAKRNFPELKVTPAKFTFARLKDMGKFGIQMQVSRLATFASEKYDEFLLGAFTSLGSVTLYNLGSKAAAYGKFFPMQIMAPIAPAAAELAALNRTDKLKELYQNTVKYLNILAIPAFIFLFFFSDRLFIAWMGVGYETSVLISRILIVGFLANFLFSAPGNIIIPNTGVPKYQMREGLIFLGINLFLSYFLIKHYGITGAAFGNAVSIVISSVYILKVSGRFFKINPLKLLPGLLLKPIIFSLISAAPLVLFFYFTEQSSERILNIIYIAAAALIYFPFYGFLLINFNYLGKNDFELFTKFLIKIPPFSYIAERERKKTASLTALNQKYEGEKVSICLITCCRVEMLKKNILSLLKTLDGINYELLIWNNNSNDGTKEFLDETFSPENGENKNIHIIHSTENIGTTARGKLFEMAVGDYIIGMDDDVLEFPEKWVQQLISAYKTIPYAGFISADVVQDSTTTGAKLDDPHYTEEKFGQIIFQSGPPGGWCFIISKKVYNETGKFYFPKNRIFFGDDGDYASRVLNRGYRTGILKGLKVYHASGIKHNESYKALYEEKMNDLKNKIPLTHKIKLKAEKILSLRRYKNRLLLYINRVTAKDED